MEEKMEERLTFKINNKKVIVDHNYDKETGKPFREQKGGTDELKKWLFEEIVSQSRSRLVIQSVLLKIFRSCNDLPIK